MKLFLFITCLLLSFTAFGQTKKDNVIYIQTDLKGAEAFTAWGKHLAQNGFSIDKAEATFGTISTGGKDIRGFLYALNSAIDDTGKIKITIKYKLKSLSGQPTGWYFETGRNNINSVIYTDLQPVFISFGHPVSYGKL